VLATTAVEPGRPVEVVLGVDTHLDAHVAVAMDRLGRTLGMLSVPTNAGGYRDLVSWAEGFGTLKTAGVEGTGSYGTGLARHLRAVGVEVLEVERPKRRRPRRGIGKSDPIDAELAARAVLAGEVAGVSKSADGRVEAIRALRAARRSAVKAKTQVGNQLRALLLTAPDDLRERLRGLTTRKLVSASCRLRPAAVAETPEAATKLAMRSVARRHRMLSEEVAELDSRIGELVAQAAPGLISLPAVGVEAAATLLVLAGDNPERLRSEASFASLCGVAPIPASSGKVVRYRLNRGGNRDANRALHMVCVVRMKEARTREYVAKRISEGKTKREIMRCLKRYVAREVYRELVRPSMAPIHGSLDI
jgi:transposase